MELILEAAWRARWQDMTPEQRATVTGNPDYLYIGDFLGVDERDDDSAER